MHVVYSLHSGGMEHGVVKLVNGLDPARVSSALCATIPGGVLTPLVKPGIPVHELTRRRGNDPRLIVQLYRLFRQQQPHIVHTHAWGTMAEGLLAARLAKVPAVVHGEHGTLQTKRHQRLAQRWGWSMADQVVSVSSRLAERLARDVGFPLDKVKTLHNGVDLTRFGHTDRLTARRSLGLPGEGSVVATIGRLVPVKDHRTLLDAMHRVVSQTALPTTLLVAGDGPLAKDLAAHASALGLGSVVRWLGHRSDVESVLAAADLFVLSSSSEGMSNTILEAMASGIPVVATRVGGADEMVVDGETGVLVSAGSPGPMAEAISVLLDDSARRLAMGAAGRCRAMNEFGLDAMINRYERLYLELADRLRERVHTSRSSRDEVGKRLCE